MKKTITILMLLLACLVAQAQERLIKGTVTDAETGDELPGISVHVKGTTVGTTTDALGKYQITVPEGATLVFQGVGYAVNEVKVGTLTEISVALKTNYNNLSEVVVAGYGKKKLFSRNKAKKDKNNVAVGRSENRIEKALEGKVTGVVIKKQKNKDIANNPPPPIKIKPKKEDKKNIQDTIKTEPWEGDNTESYDVIVENEFLETNKNPLSTFSIDVDNAAYTNIRRHLNNGQKVPKDAVRIEEMINYFKYDYPQPEGEHPFSITTELSATPFHNGHQLLMIGLQGKKIPTDNLPPSNLVFLIDVSGSMNEENKLPLLKSAFKLLVKQLRPQDKVAIVVYAGAAGLVLPSTFGTQKDKMIAALDELEAGGSTAGGAGIKLAYQIALENLMPNGNNRIILATDGDFNVGASSDGEMVQLIEEKRKSGVFLTCLGFGMGNYKDSKMEQLADKGNGNYAYIDNIQEANKVLVKEFGGTLFTIAKDVKLQLEFNPTQVKAYRLIGYENRMLADEDFNDDTKDAGELGSGHTVTALYEIIPAGVESAFVKNVDKLKYQTASLTPQANSAELMTIKFRYKEPKENKSKLLERTVSNQAIQWQSTSENYRFATAVAGFGLLLRDSKFKGNLLYKQVIELAESAKGKDEEGYRSEFIRLVRSAE